MIQKLLLPIFKRLWFGVSFLSVFLNEGFSHKSTTEVVMFLLYYIKSLFLIINYLKKLLNFIFYSNSVLEKYFCIFSAKQCENKTPL